MCPSPWPPGLPPHLSPSPSALLFFPFFFFLLFSFPGLDADNEEAHRVYKLISETKSFSRRSLGGQSLNAGLNKREVSASRGSEHCLYLLRADLWDVGELVNICLCRREEGGRRLQPREVTRPFISPGQQCEAGMDDVQGEHAVC